MKKLVLISFLLCGIILTGCSQKGGLSQSELFDKKQECSSYGYLLEKEVTEPIVDRIEEIFYSEKHNTCYGAISHLDLGTNIRIYRILDLLARKYIESEEGNERIMLHIDSYIKKIKELKGE